MQTSKVRQNGRRGEAVIVTIWRPVLDRCFWLQQDRSIYVSA